MNELKNKKLTPRQQKVYFFESINKQSNQNTLKEFLYFLKSEGKNRIDFSYSASKNALHADLSIQENYILDAIPKSLIRDNENNLQEFLKGLENPHLKVLVTSLGDLNRKVKSLTLAEKKIASLTKTILSTSKYIFLEAPEVNLSFNQLETVKDCLRYEAQKKGRTVLLKSIKKVLWPEIITDIVSKNEKSQFIITKNSLFNQEKRERLQVAPTRNSHLREKAS